MITVEQFGTGRFIKGKPSASDIEAARKGLERIKAVFASNQHNVVIMEEANVAAKLGLLSVEDMLEIMVRITSYNVCYTKLLRYSYFKYGLFSRKVSRNHAK